jgi:hypothetical protein
MSIHLCQEVLLNVEGDMNGDDPNDDLWDEALSDESSDGFSSIGM